jgi:outer membrane biosynthesis protein TonB
MNYHFLQTDLLSRRALAFSGIAAFHMLIAYLLLTALVQTPVPVPDTPIRVTVTPEVDRTTSPQLPDYHPSGHSERIPVPPQPPWAPPQDSSSQAPTAGMPSAPNGSAGIVTAQPIRLIGTNQLPNSEDYYPPDMRRQNVQGATNLRVCVDAQGTRQGDPAIEASSGFARLDAGAVNLVKHGRYARSMQGDTPVGNCFRFRITFRIPK